MVAIHRLAMGAARLRSHCRSSTLAAEHTFPEVR